MCTNLSLTQDTGKIYIQLSLSHSTCKLHGTSMYSTNLSLTRSWHKYVQISLSQDASKHMYKSLSHRTPVKICTNLSLTVSWYKYVQISPSQRSKSLCLPCSTTKAATPPPSVCVGEAISGCECGRLLQGGGGGWLLVPPGLTTRCSITEDMYWIMVNYKVLSRRRCWLDALLAG